MNNKLMITATFATLIGLFSPALVFVSNAEEATAVQTAAIDYSAMDDFMAKLSVVENGRPRIAYDYVRKNARTFLNSYVDYLSQQNVDTLSKDDQLAYWLNVQNALVVQAVSFDTKKTNLKKLRGTGPMPGDLWTKPRFPYGDKALSIADVENRIVTTSKDPNVVYGMYQGVRGAPRISRQSYQGATVRVALSQAGQTYVNSKGIVGADKDTISVSPIFLWHKDTLFGDDDAALIAHIQSHAAPSLANSLATATTVELNDLNYRTDKYNVPKQPQNRSGGGYGS